MSDHAGYQWSIEERVDHWIWTIRSAADAPPLVSGAALSRPHAAACVVRALILGTIECQPQSLAA